MRILAIFVAVSLAVILKDANAEILTNINPGICQEEVGKVAILNRDPEIWFRLDLGEIKNDISVIENLADKLDKICRNATIEHVHFKYSCSDMMLMTKTMVKNLKLDLNNMLSKKREKIHKLD